MKRRRLTEKPIIAVLREQEAGMKTSPPPPRAQLCAAKIAEQIVSCPNYMTLETAVRR